MLITLNSTKLLHKIGVTIHKLQVTKRYIYKVRTKLNSSRLNYKKHLSICFLSVKILLEHRVLLVQYTVVRLLSVLFVSRQLNKRTKGCSTVIMLKSCHLRLLCAHFTINKLSSTVIIRTK